jgi:hypothetical protein
VEFLSPAITGYTLEELNAHGGWPSVVHPDDLPVTAKTVERMAPNDLGALTRSRTLSRTREPAHEQRGNHDEFLLNLLCDFWSKPC